MATTSAPLTGVELLLSDLDGVVYAGRGAIPHAVEALNAARLTARIGYITNNASRTPSSVAQHLVDLGLPTAEDDVVTSPQAAIRLLDDLVPAGSVVLVVGGEGLSTIVAGAGFRVTSSADDNPAAVIQGFHPTVGWTQLAEAAYALRRNESAVWVATNTDWTIPQDRGIAPGNGTLVSAVHTVVGRLPVVAGKPERAIFELALDRFGTRAALVLGDRLDTDILGANRTGLPSVLVLTGIDGAKQLLAAPADQRPTYILGDLRELSQPYPAPVEERGRGGARIFRSGNATVELAGSAVRMVSGGPGADLARAGTAAVWGAGVPIYALDVDARLYS